MPESLAQQHGRLETLSKTFAPPVPTFTTSSTDNRHNTAHEHPVVLPEPPQPPAATAHAQLPSVAALSLSDDHAPVEPKLPDDLVLPPEETIQPAQTQQHQPHAYSYPPPPSGDDGSGSLPYPLSTPHLTRGPVAILCKDPAVGRGVFATRDILPGEVVEISPVLVLGEEEYSGRKKGEKSDGELRGVEASQLRGYVFTWGRDGSMAVALGIGSLFNHSPAPNVSYTLDTAQYTISYRAAKPIPQGEELTIFYGHNVRFSGANEEAGRDAVDDDEAVDDGWGGLGGLDDASSTTLDGGNSSEEDIAELRRLPADELAERDNEVIGFTEPGFPWRKVTEIVDPEDATLTTMPCYAITIPARVSAIVFQFVRKLANRKFNELGHLKRVKPVEEQTFADIQQRRQQRARSSTVSISGGDSSDGDSDSSTASSLVSSQSRRTPSIRTGGDVLQQVLLFPVASAPADMKELLAASPLAAALGDEPFPKPYIVDVPAQPAHTEEQAQEWAKVWPVQVVHIREGAKATRRKRGWERAKMEWIERQARKVWQKAEEAGKRGEHPIACHVTDSWSSGFHHSLRRPLNLVNAFDTRKTTGNVLAHAACNAIDAIGVLDLHGGRPPAHLFSPDAADPPYLLTGLSIFMSHEPCLLCAMSLLHSRIKNLFYIKRAPGAGGCGSLYNVHEDGGLNHRFEVWEWTGPTDRGMAVGEGEVVRCDP